MIAKRDHRSSNGPLHRKGSMSTLLKGDKGTPAARLYEGSAFILPNKRYVSASSFACGYTDREKVISESSSTCQSPLLENVLWVLRYAGAWRRRKCPHREFFRKKDGFRQLVREREKSVLQPDGRLVQKTKTIREPAFALSPGYGRYEGADTRFKMFVFY
jgi:hypothetical protein